MDIRHPVESDHPRILSVMKDWWQGRDLTHMLPKLFLDHFSSTSFVVEKDGKLMGFLIGFLSWDHPSTGYINLVGVHPEFQQKGIGRTLYSLFFDCCRKNSRTIVQSCTAVVNEHSIAFHKCLGFNLTQSDDSIEDSTTVPDHKSPGSSRVLFKKHLTDNPGDSHMIRPAGIEDSLLLSSIICISYQDVAQTFNLTAENCPKHPSNCTNDWIKKDMARGAQYHILFKDGLPAGCAAVETADNDVSYLERLAVLPGFRHSGFGKQLVRHIQSQAKASGSTRVSIGIIAEQTRLKHWYERLGFVYLETKTFDHLPFQVGFMTLDI